MAAVGGAAQKKLLPATDVYLLPRTGAWHPRTEDTGLCAATWVCVLIVRGPCVFRIYTVSIQYLHTVSILCIYTVYLNQSRDIALSPHRGRGRTPLDQN